MTHNTLDSIKNDVSKLIKVFKALNVVFPGTQMIMISVLLQNMAHKAYECVNYSHEGDIKTIRDAISVIRELREYNAQAWVVQWVLEELDIIMVSNDMLEDKDNLDEVIRYPIHEEIEDNKV